MGPKRAPKIPLGSSPERRGFKVVLRPASPALCPAVQVHTVDGITQVLPMSFTHIPYFQPYQPVIYIRNLIAIYVSSPGLKQHDHIAFHPAARHPQYLDSLTFCS